jgi:bifunctional DNase/RNase
LSERPPVAPPEFRMAIVGDVNITLPSQFPTVVLRETEAPRRQLSFAVGMQDGVGLSHALRRIPTPRPLTHELVTDVLSGFDIDVVAIRIVGRQGKTYFAELDLRGRTGRNVYSCRPTDALAVALHQAVPVPILIDSRLFEAEGDVAPWSPPTRAADLPAPEADQLTAAADPPTAAADPPTPEVEEPGETATGPTTQVVSGGPTAGAATSVHTAGATGVPNGEAATGVALEGTHDGPSSVISTEEAGDPASVAEPAAEGVSGT